MRFKKVPDTSPGIFSHTYGLHDGTPRDRMCVDTGSGGVLGVVGVGKNTRYLWINEKSKKEGRGDVGFVEVDLLKRSYAPWSSP